MPSAIARDLSHAAGGAGRALPDATRAPMERMFGADFSAVRVHTGPVAQDAAVSLNAHALTMGTDIFFNAGAYQPGSRAGDRLLAHELAHVVQQADGRPRAAAQGAVAVSGPDDAEERAADAAVGRIFDDRRAPDLSPRAGGGPVIQRKIMMRGPNTWIFFSTWTEFTAAQRAAFVRRWFGAADQGLARRIVADMADATDEFKFENELELFTEVFKRLRTSQLMRETQRDLGAHGKAFGYPVRNSDGTWSATCGPRVNKAAARYWGPVQGLSDDYEFPLTPFGQEHAYDALVALFTPQPGKCDRTLIHCDYLASVVHYRVFAETIGANVFTERVKNGTIPLTLKWNGFDDIEEKTFRSAERESLREVRPSSERDLVIGDHVIFWNHRAYDLINEVVREAWRLENAVLVDRTRGVDTFLGHGSGEQTKSTMLGKLVDRYNDVVRKALAVIARTTSRDAATSAAARVQMAHDFPRIKPVGSGWHVQGDGHGKMFDDPVASITIANPDLIGLRDPEDLSRMNLVKRPKESE
jgi:hypothetical protein